MKIIDNYLERNKERIFGLDVVRSIAILLVVYGHSSTILPVEIRRKYLSILPFIDGVSIFFVLSGFLIGGILLRTIKNTDFTRNDLFNFWIRRWFRTLPNYYLVLTLFILVSLKLYKNLSDFNWKYYIFSQNLFFAHPVFYAEAWSLSVEEWFYLLFPLSFFILFKITKNKKSSFLIAASLFLFIPLIWRIYNSVNGIQLMNWDLYYRKVVVMRLDSLMYGIFGSYLYFYKNEMWVKLKNIGLIAGISVILYLTLYHRFNANKSSFFYTVYMYNLESLATLFIMPYFSELKKIKFKYVAVFFTFISITSYSMYLLNFSHILGWMIPYTLAKFGITDNPVPLIHTLKYFLFWFYLIAGSYMLNKFFEVPVMNLRDKIKHR